MGTTVTISGSNFSSAPAGNTVTLNGLAAKVLQASSTQLQVAVPEGGTAGKFSVSVNGMKAVSADDFTVTDFPDPLAIKGLFVQFEKRGWASGYYPGEVVKDFNSYDTVVGHRVSAEVELQLDEMKKINVNAIALELRATDSYYSGDFKPPDCNLPPTLGLLYPNPTGTELNNLVQLFDLINSKQIKIILWLNNTHMEEQPPSNNAAWLTAILNVVKNHPALELVCFGGNTHLIDSNGDGVGDSCGMPAEAPLWLGPSSVPARYCKWAIQLGLSLGVPAIKLSAEAVVGNYFVDAEPGAGPDATDNHLWKTIAILKRVFDDLGIADNQRTYAISMYEHRKCFNPNNLDVPCAPDADPDAWADETLRHIYETIGRNGSRVIAVEMGLYQADPNWSTSQALESLVRRFKRYGVAGGCFWRWAYFSDSENNDASLAMPVKIRGWSFQYTVMRDVIQQCYR